MTQLRRAWGYLRQHLGQTLYNNAYFIMLAALVPAITGYLFWGVATRLFSVEQVGVASALLSVTAFLTLFSGMDLGTTLIRYLPTDPDPVALINTTIWLRAGLATLASVIFLAGISVWSPAQQFLTSSPALALMFALTNVLQSINELVLHVFVAYRQSRLAFLKNLYIAVARFPVVIAGALWIAGFDGVGLYLGIMISVLVVVVYCLWRMFPQVHPHYAFRWQFAASRLRPLFRFSLSNFVSELLLQMPLLLIPLIVVNLLGNEDSGIAYVVMMLSSVVAILPQGMARSLFSESTANRRLLRANTLRVLVLSFGLETILILGLLFTERLLLTLAFGAAYAARGETFLLLSALAVVPMTVVLVNVSLQRVQGHLRRLMLLGVVVCVSSLALIMALTPTYGLTGVGIGFLVGQVAGAVLSLPWLGEALMTARRGARQPTEYSSNHKTMAAILGEHLATLRPHATILDIGCGSGSLTDVIQGATEDPVRVVGVDIDGAALRLAHREHPQAWCWFAEYDGYQLPLAPGSIDFAIGQEVIEHVPDAGRFMAALATVLKPGGVCLLTTPNAALQPLTAASHPDHVRHYLPAELHTLAAAHGLVVADTYYRYHRLSWAFDRLLLAVGRRALPTYEVQPHMTVVDTPDQYLLLRLYDRWVDPVITVIEQVEFKLMRRFPAPGQVCILRRPPQPPGEAPVIDATAALAAPAAGGRLS